MACMWLSDVCLFQCARTHNLIVCQIAQFDHVLCVVEFFFCQVLGGIDIVQIYTDRGMIMSQSCNKENSKLCHHSIEQKRGHCTFVVLRLQWHECGPAFRYICVEIGVYGRMDFFVLEHQLRGFTRQITMNLKSMRQATKKQKCTIDSRIRNNDDDGVSIRDLLQCMNSMIAFIVTIMIC